MAGLDPFDDQVVDFVHAYLAVCEEVSIDRSGRVLLPPELRDLAGITKDVRVFSVLDRLEIWDADRWEARFAAAREAGPNLRNLRGGEAA